MSYSHGIGKSVSNDIRGSISGCKKFIRIVTKIHETDIFMQFEWIDPFKLLQYCLDEKCMQDWQPITC